MNALERLEEWKNKHKAHSVVISHDDGYGASCWSVELFRGKQMIVCCDFYRAPDEHAPQAFREFTEQEIADDVCERASLEEVINEAINRAEAKWTLTPADPC